MGFKAYAAPSATGVGPVTSPSTAGESGPGGWHPTIIYMVALIVVEIVVVALLGRTLLK
jgi:hypothetical protein